jgi:hypothetical protein
MILPGAVAEHSHAPAVRTIVGIGDRAAEKRRDAEQRKELCRHLLRVYAPRVAHTGQRELRQPPGSKSSKRAALALPVEPVGRRDVGVAVATAN